MTKWQKQANKREKQATQQRKQNQYIITNEQTTDQVAIIYVGYYNSDDIIAYIKLSLLQQQQCCIIYSLTRLLMFTWCCHNGPNRNGQTHSRCCRRGVEMRKRERKMKEENEWGIEEGQRTGVKKDDIMTVQWM